MTNEGIIEVETEALAELVEPVDDRVTMQMERLRRFLHRPLREEGVERRQELPSAAIVGLQQGTQMVPDIALREERVLRHDQVGQHLLVVMRTTLRPEPAAEVDRLLCLQVGP